MKGRAVAAGLLLAVAACHRHVPPPPAAAVPHYVVGAPWQGADGAWYYPKEAFDYQATGLAIVDPTHPHPLTADGEVYRADIPAAAHQTLQLPAIVRVTNLENGRALLLRVNDRGPAQQGRIMSVTPAAARLLLMQPDAATRVRIESESGLSRHLAAQLGGGPRLDIEAAPVIGVQEQSLSPSGSGAVATPSVPAAADAVVPGDDAPVPDPLPPQLEQGAPDRQALWIDAGRFNQRSYAEQVAAAINGSVQSDGRGRETVYIVRGGPFQRTSDADAALDQARHAGVTGARIIVE